MTDTITLSSSDLDLDPGSEVSCEVRVHNDGNTVEGYALEVVGDAASYATVQPSTLTVYPHEEEVATVRVAAPRSSALASGAIPLGVRVIPAQRPADAVVPEATVHVRPFADDALSLMPRTSRARWRARHALVLENRGNTAVSYDLEAVDPDGLLRISARPRRGVVQPGTAAVCRLVVRPDRTLWRGTSRLQAFSVAMHAEGRDPVTVEGALLQSPVLSAGLGKVVLAAIAACAVALAAWLGPLRSSVRSAAVDAVAAPAQQAAQQAAAATTSAKAADSTAKQASSTAADAAATAAKSKKDAQAANAATVAGAAAVKVDRTLSLKAAPGKSATASFPVPTGKALAVTDLLAQSTGDDMTLTLLRGSAVVLPPLSGTDFRLYDLHQVTAIGFDSSAPLVARLDCVKPAVDNTTGSCTGALYFAGSLAPVVPPSAG